MIQADTGRYAGFRASSLDRELRWVVRGLCHDGCVALSGLLVLLTEPKHQQVLMLRTVGIGIRFATRFQPP